MNNNENSKIFGSLEVESPETLKVLIDEMNKEQAIFLLTESVKYAHRRGLFTLIESEIVSKSIRKIYETENQSVTTE